MLSKVLLLCLLPFAVARADDAQALNGKQWLEKMNQAMKSLDFQGTVAFMKNNKLETMSYGHQIIAGAEEERLVSLNSPMREVKRHASEVSCVYKESNEKIVNHHPIDRSLLISLPVDLSQLDGLYQVRLENQEAIAMRSAQKLAIKAEDGLRYSRAIWIDQQYFLPLKIEVYGAQGEVVEQAVFTQIDVHPSAVSMTAQVDENNLHVKHIHSSHAEPLENAEFKLAHWPNGFQPVFFIRNSIHDSEQAIDHLLISDGLASVSVYLEARNSKPAQGLQSMGAVNSFSRVIGDKQLTVLGEVPAKTVELIADGVSLR